MALQKADPGGEYYFSVGISAGGVWSGTTGTVGLTNTAPAGRLTTYAITVATNAGVDFSYATNFATMVMGGAYYIPPGTNFTVQPIMVTFDLANVQTDLRNDVSGHLVFTRNGTVLGTSTNAFSPGQGWVYIEIQVTINSTVGAAQVWVNGVSWLNLTGVNTQATANAYMNKTRWGSCIINSAGGFWKDMYSLDTGTGANTSRLGDIQVGVSYPNSAGPKQQWANTGGASQTASVQDGISHTGTWPDGDVTYISDSSSGDISDFNHQALGTGTVYGIIHTSYVRSDAGAANFEQYTNSSGTIHTTSSIAVGTSYNYYFDIEEVDPATSSQWTVSGYNAATFGVKIP